MEGQKKEQQEIEPDEMGEEVFAAVHTSIHPSIYLPLPCKKQKMKTSSSIHQFRSVPGRTKIEKKKRAAAAAAVIEPLYERTSKIYYVVNVVEFPSIYNLATF